jgi:xylulokinase
MPDPILLAHDIGTSGTKSSLVSVSGGVLASFSAAHDTKCPHPGWAQQDPADWWEGVCANSRRLAEAHGDLVANVAGIGVSGHMLGAVPIGPDGRPLRPAMIHSDTRATEAFDRLSRTIGPDKVYELTGNLLDPRGVICKMLHLARNEPDVYRKAHRFVQSKDYVVGCMTGNWDTTDLSDASHAQWLDIKARGRGDALLEEVGLDAGKIPTLHRSTDVVGTLTAEAARRMQLPQGLPVVAGAGDGACASAGAGAVTPGDTYGCLGTTAWLATITAEPVIDPGRRLFNILALDANNGLYGTVQSAGRSIQWVLDLAGEEGFERFDEILSAIEPGCDGLVFLPYLEGERSPIFDADARGVYFGIHPGHRREHFVRAAVEGVSFALRSVLEVLRESADVRALPLIGGGGQSHAWQRMLADICAAEIRMLSTRAPDATSLGAALAAGVGVGVFDDLASAAAGIRVTQRIAAAETPPSAYDRNYAIYRRLYPDLKNAFADLQQRLRAETS